MTIEAFDLLSEEDKLTELLRAGRVMSEKKENKNRCFLYYMGSFYVAVKYDNESDALVDITAFSNIDRKDRIEWKVLRVLPGLQHLYKGKADGLF